MSCTPEPVDTLYTFVLGSPFIFVVAQKVYTLFGLVTGQVSTASYIGVLFRLVYLEADGTGYDWFHSIYQGNPSILPKGQLWLSCLS